jgi:hypothetical protein
MHHSPEKSATEASTGALRKVRGAHTEAAVDGSKAMAIVEIDEKSASISGAQFGQPEDHTP